MRKGGGDPHHGAAHTARCPQTQGASQEAGGCWSRITEARKQGQQERKKGIREKLKDEIRQEAVSSC